MTNTLESDSARRHVALGAANMALAVVLGAFGAHALKGALPADMLEVYKTGVLYHMVHSLGLVFLAAVSGMVDARRAQWVGRCFLAGIVLFCASLYALALSGIKVFGAITPLGGIAFIAGWILLATAARGNLAE